MIFAAQIHRTLAGLWLAFAQSAHSNLTKLLTFLLQTGRPIPVGPFDLYWRKSTASAATNCVEVAELPGTILVRDSKDPDDKKILCFSNQDWRHFVEGVKAGELDRL
jgi:hypothetical protein